MDGNQELRILFVEDLISDAELAQRTLRKEGIPFTSLRVENEIDFVSALREFHPDVIVSDYSMPSFDGMRALRLTLAYDPTLPLIILTGSMNEITAVACMKAGATDYVIKEHITRLPLAVKGALEQKEFRRAKEQADRELRETNQMLEAIIQASPLAISVLDREAKLTLWSPAMETIFGWKAEEVLGKELPIIPDHLRETVLREIRERFEGTSITMQETLRQHKDGSLVEVSLSAAPIRDAQGQITGIMGITADINERKRAERAFMESEERFRALTQSVSDAIIITDHLHRIVFWNKGAENLFHFLAEEVVGQLPDFLIPEPDLKSHNQAVNRFDETGIFPLEKNIFEGKAVRKDGSTIPVEISLSTWGTGNRKYSGAILRDITERKRAEQTLRQRLVELEALHTVSAELRGARTLDDALSILIDKTLSALQAEAGVIWMYHPDSNELRMAASRSWLDELGATTIPPGQGIVGRVFTSGETLHMPELASFLGGSDLSPEGAPRDWGGACVPIRTSEETIGVLCVSMPIRQSMSAEQSRLLSSLAELAGITLQRMRLHDETLRRLEQLQALREVDQAITSNLDMKVSLNVVLEQAIHQLGVEGAIVHLLNPNMRTLEWAAGRGVELYTGKKTTIRLGKNLAGQAALQRHTLSMANLDPLSMEGGQSAIPDALLQRFATHYAVPLISKGEVKGVLEVYHHEPLETNLEWVDFLETLAGQAAITIDNSQLFENLWHANLELSIAYDATIEGWSRALDLRDKDTEGHSKRVTEMTEGLAIAMGMKENELIHIRRGCLLHDIGKLGVPDYILHKTGPLSADEWELMRKHPVYAHEMLLPIQFLHPAIDIPYRHHEKWDGTGYPSGFKGNEIPLAAQIFAVVDVWDALISDRPYRPAWSPEKAEAYLREQSGKHFNPSIVTEFLKLLKND